MRAAISMRTWDDPYYVFINLSPEIKVEALACPRAECTSKQLRGREGCIMSGRLAEHYQWGIY
jgi:hypothetical protein